ncbi:L,D-transpeptidase family protein [Haliea sp. E17]|uniref:L,D-transpeptidase family protein n=1 Tax=Haliea sp. E17 TaxID=3401576 RepID=UPI003AAB181E
MTACLLAIAIVPVARADTAAEIRRALTAPAQEAWPGSASRAATGAVEAFYQRRGYLPAWQGTSGEMTAQALALREAIAASSAHGLDPRNYHLTGIDRLWPAQQDSDQARLDLLLTDALAQLALDLYQGRTDPASVDPEWHIPVSQLDIAPILDSAPSSPDLAALLQRLAPPGAVYAQLQAALLHYRELARQGDWPTLPPGPTLRPGDRDQRILALRERLRAEGYASERAVGDPQAYDTPLEQAVLRFQRLHTLVADGLVGKRTTAALNVPLAGRIGEIQLNLERWRWLPRQWPQRYVLINTAAFELQAVRDGERELDMRVIVGRPQRSTPAMVSAIRGITVNPYWNVPESIARKDLVPAQIRNPDYLASRQIRIFANWSPGAAELDPAQVDWEALRNRHFPYYLRQEPGPKNALGRIKFLSDNDFSIYLHDTPDRQLFQREVRTFSSGCIRVQTAQDLALWLFANIEGWSDHYLQSLVDSGINRNILLPQPVPLYLLYLTTWIDSASGELHFAEDIYARDRPLAARLAAPAADPDCGATEGGEG